MCRNSGITWNYPELPGIRWNWEFLGRPLFMGLRIHDPFSQKTTWNVTFMPFLWSCLGIKLQHQMWRNVSVPAVFMAKGSCILKTPKQKLGFSWTEPPGTTSAGTRIRTLYLQRCLWGNNMGKLKLSQIPYPVAHLYINLRGSREYTIWAISGSDLGQITPNIWTPPWPRQEK